jgi:propionyl-CoA synthetase
MPRMGSYRATYDRSLTDREAFWREAAAAVDWRTPPTTVLDESRAPFYRWFPDGELNTCENALDRHVAAGHGDRPALVYDSPVTGTKRTYSYAQLLDETATFAGALTSLGVGKGDRVVIYLPMVPEAVVAMLACARLGAVHSVVFGGFAPHELAVRIDDARPKVVVSASCGIEVARVIEYKPLLDRALDLAEHAPDHVVVLQRPQAPAALTAPRDLDWHELVAGAEPAGCVPVAGSDPLYVLYTSGTTARPKGVVRDNGGHAVALTWSMPNIYGIGPGDVWWSASDVGWVVGHSYIVYAPLLVGATTVLYEGKPVGTPDAGAFWRVIEEYGVRALFTAPVSGWASRWSTTGGRPRPAGRSRPTCAAWSRCRSSRGRRRSRCRAGTCRSSTRTASRCRPAPRGRSASGCRCRRGRCSRCGTTTSGSCRRTCEPSTATT